MKKRLVARDQDKRVRVAGLEEFEAEDEASDGGCPLTPPVIKVISLVEEVIWSATQPIRGEGAEEEEEEEEEENSDAYFKRK